MSVDLTVWPPRYDRAYRPDPAAEYWFPELECCDPGTRDGLILEKLRRQVEWAWRRSPFYRRKWETAGGAPATPPPLDAPGKVPLVQKAPLRLPPAPAPPDRANPW